jgi:nitroimidazol reductase NimA-like FMN-containing flavoprotein (pyridoxamine 5'-phosphate oxidase superfamily)
VHPLSEEKAYAFLETAPVAHIGVVHDGEPYVTPMSFVVENKKVLFRTKPGRRFAALETNPTVSIEVSSYDTTNGDWTSVIVKGTAHETNDDGFINLTVEKLFEKYRDVMGSPLGRSGIQPMATFPHVVVVDIEEISGMASSGGFGMRTRPGRL